MYGAGTNPSHKENERWCGPGLLYILSMDSIGPTGTLKLESQQSPPPSWVCHCATEGRGRHARTIHLKEKRSQQSALHANDKYPPEPCCS